MGAVVGKESQDLKNVDNLEYAGIDEYSQESAEPELSLPSLEDVGNALKGHLQATNEAVKTAKEKGDYFEAGRAMSDDPMLQMTGLGDMALFGALARMGKAAKADLLATVKVEPDSVAVNVANGPRLNNQLLVEEVSSGHGFQKHVQENAEFENLGIVTQEQYQSFVEDIVSNSATEVRYAANGKVFYLDRSTNTVVIKSPNGEATAFRPDYGAHGIGWDDFLDQQVPGPSQSLKNNPSYDPVNNGRIF
jgi:hypothetical protein